MSKRRKGDSAIDIDIRGTQADLVARRQARFRRRLLEGASIEQVLAEEQASRPAEDEARRKYLAEVEWLGSGDAIEWAELENHRLAQIAKKVIRGARDGGRQDPDRDLQMAREFVRRRQKSGLSDSALMKDIGRKRKLRRSAAIEAVRRGLKKIVR
jgi:hypothetical protein